MKFLKVCTVLLLFILIFSYLIREIHCLDVWLHLKTGEYILENGTFPRHDIFSYTMPNKPWINHEWLSQVVFYAIYNKFGFDGLIILRALVVSSAFLLLFLLGYRKENYLIMALLLLATLFISKQRFLLRGELFTFLFTALSLLILNKR